MKIVIIGGVAGGASAATRLRRLDETAEILILERGPDISFASCGMPYYIGDVIKSEKALLLNNAASFREKYNIEVRALNNVDRINREKKTLTVTNRETGKTYEESYDKLLIATGAEPIIPPIAGMDSKRVFTLRSVPDAVKIKTFLQESGAKRAVIVGGGAIGLEMAENFRHIGLDVTIVEMSGQLLAPTDVEMAAQVQTHAEQNGIKVILNNGAKEIIDDGGELTVKLNDGEIKADMLLMAVGVRPDSALAREAGIELNPRGAVIVDETMRTSDPDIYAVGDVVQVYHIVTGQPMSIFLAGPANRQARIAADNLAGQQSKYPGVLGTGIVKLFDMTVAFTGVNEKTAKENNLDYDKVYLTLPQHAGYYPGGREMKMKVLFEKTTGKILGAQIVGFDGVDKRVDIFATVIKLGGTALDLQEIDFCYSPPYGMPKDPANMAGYVIENVVKKHMSQYHWNEVAEIPKDGSATLLDVRETKDKKLGDIDGFSYMPLEELREKMQEIDKGKPVYVNCKSGRRGYNACRALEAQGYKVANLAGGIMIYGCINESCEPKEKKSN